MAGRRVCFDVPQDASGVRADNIHRVTPRCCPIAEGPEGDTAAHERAGWPVETAPGPASRFQRVAVAESSES